MKILFLIDPCDLWPEMLGHRYVSFARMVKSLEGRHNVSFCIPDLIARSDLFSPNLPCQYKIIPSVQIEWEWYGQYHLSALSDNFGHASMVAMQPFIEQMHEMAKSEYDVVITNCPWPGLRQIFFDSVVFNYELGIFNRHPFPIYHQLDPIGMYRKGLIFNLPNLDLNLSSRPAYEQLSQELMRAGLVKTGDTNGIFFPLQSEKNWPIRQEFIGLNIPGILVELTRSFPDEVVYITQKSNYPLSENTRAAISKIKNVVEIIDIRDSAAIVPIFKKVFSLNSSLGFQALFWGKKLISFPNTSLYPWTRLDHDKAKDLLGGLLETFWIRQDVILNPKSFSDRLEGITKISKDALLIN